MAINKRREGQIEGARAVRLESVCGTSLSAGAGDQRSAKAGRKIARRFRASCRRNRPAVMVMPERETPGNSARAWATADDGARRPALTCGMWRSSRVRTFRPPHQQPDDDQQPRDQHGLVKAVLRLFFRNSAPTMRSGNRADHQQPEETPLPVQYISWHARETANSKACKNQFDPIAEKVNHDREAMCPCEARHRTPGRAPSIPEPRNQNQMRAAADRKKFGEALDDGEDDGLAQRHAGSRLLCVCSRAHVAAASDFAHVKRVYAVKIVAAQDAVGTIAVARPEGNAGGVVRCRFQLYFANAARRASRLRWRV